MKRIPLSDPIFNEVSHGFTRRAVVNELLSSRTVFKTPVQAWFSKVQNIVLVGFLVIIAALSAYTIASVYEGEKARKIAIHEIYSGNKAQVEQKKAEAFSKEGLR
jgi:hypothetical protein